MENEEIRFGRFRLDLRRPELRCDGQPVRIDRLALAILCALAEAKGEIVNKDELMARLWPGRIVEEGNLHVHVSALRKSLDEHGEGHSFVVTVPGRGYRLADLTGVRSAPLAEGSLPPQLPLPDNPSIAVLAFRNLSGDPEREYFADGVVEDIITTLSRFPRFVVIPRSSSYLYKGRSVDMRQMGRELDARYVLDGSIRIARNRLRISCVLIDAVSGRHLWAENYDGAMEDVFDLQDKITSSIVATITPKVLGAEITRAQAKPTDSLSAYDLYLRAVAKMGPGQTESSVNEAVELLHRATTADPRFAAAYGLLACAYWQRFTYGWGSSDDAKARGLSAAKLAVELGRDDPIALYLGGYGIAYLGGRLEEGLAHIERSLSLNPNSVPAWRFGGTVCWMLGDHEKSIQYYERTMQLSPRDAFEYQSYAGIAAPHFFLGNYDQAILWADRSLQIKPRYLLALGWKIAALAMSGSNPDELRDAAQQLMSMYPGLTIAFSMPRLRISRSSDRELVRTALRKAGIPE